MRRLRSVALVVAVVAAGIADGGERSHPIDCRPDRVVAWAPVAVNPAALFGATFVPGILLGPPGDSPPQQGSLSVAALGNGGSVTLAFDDVELEDRPGADFIVFENAFFRLPLPAAASDEFRVFVEPALVEVSLDGVSWHAFPYDAAALAAASGVADVGRDQWLQLAGLAGVTPTFSGNWTVANSHDVFDPAGTGGISGAGGDAFDLADVGLSRARFVRLTDLDAQNGFAGGGEGFDLDAVVALHAVPRTPAATDTDGDGLSDAEESARFGSDPLLADSDGDGIDDGRELAGCRDANGASDAPFDHDEPRLWLRPDGAGCTELRWTFLGTGAAYDVLRAELAALTSSAGEVDLGIGTCVADEVSTPRWSCDGELPVPGDAFVYVVRSSAESHYGTSTAFEPRVALPDCP